MVSFVNPSFQKSFHLAMGGLATTIIIWPKMPKGQMSTQRLLQRKFDMDKDIARGLDNLRAIAVHVVVAGDKRPNWFDDRYDRNLPLRLFAKASSFPLKSVSHEKRNIHTIDVSIDQILDRNGVQIVVEACRDRAMHIHCENSLRVCVFSFTHLLASMLQVVVERVNNLRHRDVGGLFGERITTAFAGAGFYEPSFA